MYTYIDGVKTESIACASEQGICADFSGQSRNRQPNVGFLAIEIRTIGMMRRTSSRLSERLLNTIEDRIASGEYPPGVHLDEAELASDFGASRTPIREALIRLSSTGMIEKRPRKGWVVLAASPSRLIEMFEVMAELEAMCG